MTEMSFSRKPLPLGCKRFSYRELQHATGNFAENAIIGEGGFGRVYRGTLDDGRAVAIKCLDRLGLQGNREFNVEVETLGQLRHPHLVNLVGACTEARHRLAVFDFMPGGSLRDNLDSKHIEQPGPWQTPHANLTWAARLLIALDAASGLAYLHELTQPGLIHRDVKSSNILIDKAGHARMADFGLAMRTGHCSGPAAAHFETGPTRDADMLTGTFGYSAPEYESSGRMSQKCDVYSFGVVLLELLSGKQPVNTDADRSAGSQMLADEFQPLFADWKLEELKAKLDPVLPAGSVPAVQLAYFLEVTATCLQNKPVERPKMSQVVRYLSHIMRLKDEAPPQQENGRYTLTSLMDVEDVMPVCSSLDILPHTPMTYAPPQLAGAVQSGLADVAERPMPTQSARQGNREGQATTSCAAEAYGSGHWPIMPILEAAQEDASAAPNTLSPFATQQQHLRPGPLQQAALTSNSRGQVPDSSASSKPMPFGKPSQRQEGWVLFGEVGKRQEPSGPTDDIAHFWSNEQGYSSFLKPPSRRPPPPPSQQMV